LRHWVVVNGVVVVGVLGFVDLVKGWWWLGWLGFVDLVNGVVVVWWLGFVDLVNGVVVVGWLGFINVSDGAALSYPYGVRREQEGIGWWLTWLVRNGRLKR
jgi:hypothetical protein